MTRPSSSTCCWDFWECSCFCGGISFQPRATPGKNQPFRFAPLLSRPGSQKSERLNQERRKKGRKEGNENHARTYGAPSAAFRRSDIAGQFPLVLGWGRAKHTPGR